MKLNPEYLVKTITHAYRQKKGVFEKRVNAEDHLPEHSSYLEKARFLFFVIQLDYSVKSQNLYAGAKKLWQENNKYFSPVFILNLSQDNLVTILKAYLKPRYINEAVNRWQINAAGLLEKYSGNPLLIFKEKSAIEILKRIQQFRGFGPKIGNFFFRAMVNTFNLEFDDIEDIPQPVDVHDIRLTFEWGLIDNKRLTQKNVQKTQKVWQKACKKTGISWLEFDKALWLLGSEGIRSPNPLDDLKENLELSDIQIAQNE